MSTCPYCRENLRLKVEKGTPIVKREKNYLEESMTISSAFEQFWSLQLRKIGKAKCWRWWKEKRIDSTCWHNADCSGDECECYLKFVVINKAWKKQLPIYAEKQTKYQPHPMTWLNEGRWDDDLDSINGKMVSKKSARELAIERGLHKPKELK